MPAMRQRAQAQYFDDRIVDVRTDGGRAIQSAAKRSAVQLAGVHEMMMDKRQDIVGTVNRVCAILRHLKIPHTTGIDGAFFFAVAGRKLRRDSGIGGTGKWFWEDTKKTARWIDISERGQMIRRAVGRRSRIKKKGG